MTLKQADASMDSDGPVYLEGNPVRIVALIGGTTIDGVFGEWVDVIPWGPKMRVKVDDLKRLVDEKYTATPEATHEHPRIHQPRNP